MRSPQVYQKVSRLMPDRRRPAASANENILSWFFWVFLIDKFRRKHKAPWNIEPIHYVQKQTTRTQLSGATYTGRKHARMHKHVQTCEHTRMHMRTHADARVHARVHACMHARTQKASKKLNKILKSGN